MVIPFIASVMRDVFEVVPTMLKESAYGWVPPREVVRYVVLPTPRPVWWAASCWALAVHWVKPWP
jgi:ABC-type phosphate transport system permease subunit